MSKAGGQEKRNPWPENRWKTFTESGQAFWLPTVSAFEHLFDDMMALGPIRAREGFSGGVRPADWPEIGPFCQSTGRAGTVWERETLAAMCAAYAVGFTSDNPLALSPKEIADKKRDAA